MTPEDCDNCMWLDKYRKAKEEIERLKELCGEAFDAGLAHRVWNHELCRQTPPGKEEWMSAHLDCTDASGGEG